MVDVVMRKELVCSSCVLSMQAPAQCLYIVAMGSISALSNGETKYVYFECPALRG